MLLRWVEKQRIQPIKQNWIPQNQQLILARKATTGKPGDTLLSQQLGVTDTGIKKQEQTTAAVEDAKKHLSYYIRFSVDQQNGVIDNGTIGLVLIKDTGVVRTSLDELRVNTSSPVPSSWLFRLSCGLKMRQKKMLPDTTSLWN